MSNKNSLISCIVPVFDASPLWVNHCIKSIVNQSYNNIEVILVDNGATKENKELLATYESNPKAKIIHLETNLGVNGGRNVGLDAAQGEYITFSDSDDKTLDDCYKKCMDKFNKYDIDLVCYNHNRVVRDWDLKRLKKPYVDFKKSEGLHSIDLNYDVWRLIWDKVYKRKIFDDLRFPIRGVEGFDPVIEEDLLINAFIALKVNKYYTIKECLYSHQFNKTVKSLGDRYSLLGINKCVNIIGNFSYYREELIKNKNKYPKKNYDVALSLLNTRINLWINWIQKYKIK